MRAPGQGMKSIDALVKRAIEYKEKGLSDKEIGDELHLSPETVTWLLSRGVGGGAFSSNYASPEGKKVVIVDDVLSTGDTVKGAINDIQEAGGTPVLTCVVVNKTGQDDIQGVPLRALIRARAIA